MSININGGMILGSNVEKIKKLPCDIDDLGNWAYNNGMTTMSPWFDSAPENWTIGFKIKDTLADEINNEWMANIKAKATKFEELTGTKAILIGTANVC